MASPTNGKKLSVNISVHVDTPYRSSTMTVLGLKVRADDLVSNIKSRVSSSTMIPFPDQALFFGGRCLPDGSRLDECGLEDGTFLDFVVRASDEVFAEQLTELIQSNSDQDMSATELGTLYFYKHGASASQALRILGCIWGEKFRDFLWRHPRFCLEKGRVTLSASTPSVVKVHSAGQNQAFLNLHAQLMGNRALENASRALRHVCDLVPRLLFLNVARVVPGGSAASGTAVAGSITAEAVLLIRGLPLTGLERTLPNLVTSTTAALQEQLVGTAGIERIWHGGEVVRMQVEGSVQVDVRFAPADRAYTDTVGAMSEQKTKPSNGREQPEAARRVLTACFAERKNQFIHALPEPVKMTIRLLKWWRGKCQWSTSKACPSDQLLELVAAWSSADSQPTDLHTAVMNVIGLLARFKELKATWNSDVLCYGEERINPSMLSETPLLVDPVNPFVNLAEPQSFDPSEMMSSAQATRASFFSSEFPQ